MYLSVIHLKNALLSSQWMNSFFLTLSERRNKRILFIVFSMDEILSINNQTFFTSVHTLPARRYFHFYTTQLKYWRYFTVLNCVLNFIEFMCFHLEFSWLIITFGILTLFNMSQCDAWRTPMDSNASIEFERKSSKNLPLHFDQHIKEEKIFSA